ncbi:DNA methyltransferase [Comamonas sp. A7-5]|uniref:DNA methyltransferase n=1 Tax=Comamonas sp. A7-5 TaxID=673549 RepID=UPI0031D3BCAF
MKHFDVHTPKRRSNINSKAKESYPYYAGYAEAFARDAIQRLSIAGATVLDPWNGAGTTTYAAATMERRAFGFDLNPVMVVVAKAKCASMEDVRKARETLDDLSLRITRTQLKSDAVSPWVGPRAAALIRQLVSVILFPIEEHQEALTLNRIGQAVSLASPSDCLLILAIFRAVKLGAAKSFSSNPTWTKLPVAPEKWTSIGTWRNWISDQMDFLEKIHKEMSENNSIDNKLVDIECASSEKISLVNASVDVVLTSPPYCTRIDYAMATLIELAVLGLSTDDVNSTLRKNLLGTTAIRGAMPERLDAWGMSCNLLLDQVYDHPSKGSKSYYYKNFLQYFDSLYRSIGEISRVTKDGGVVCSVLQGSYYKECQIDLPKIFMEMSLAQRLNLTEMASFDVAQNFGSVNSKSLKYRESVVVSEKVLVLKKV